MNFQAPGAGQLKPGTHLRHYKGGLYVVVGTCLIEATLKTGILYRPLQGEMQHVTWMRPVSEFLDTVKTVDGVVPRFVVVEDAATAPARE